MHVNVTIGVLFLFISVDIDANTDWNHTGTGNYGSLLLFLRSAMGLCCTYTEH